MITDDVTQQQNIFFRFLITLFNTFDALKQIVFILSCVYTVIDHGRRHNVKRTKSQGTRLRIVPYFSVIFTPFIYLTSPTRAGSPQQLMPITVGPHYLTHPVNFPCGRKPEYPEKTHDLPQSVDLCSSHMRTGSENTAGIRTRDLRGERRVV